MSNEAITWCSKLHPGPGPKAVLFCLADKASDHSGEDWTCFPSVRLIVEFTDMSAPTVRRHLGTLWREGYISRKRRRRPDGTLGIYDFFLHREADHRAALKAARAAVQATEEAMDLDDGAACRPALNMSGGPALNMDAASAQNGPSPALKLSAQEPSGEPKYNPHRAGAREPGDQGWKVAFEAWPASGRKRTDLPAMRAAWAWAAGAVGGERLLAALRRAKADPDLATGDFGFPGLHTFLRQERWRFYLPAETAASAPAVAWPGPAALRAALLDRLGEGFAVNLDRCGWDAARAAVIAPTSWTHRQLAELAEIFNRHGAVLAPLGANA